MMQRMERPAATLENARWWHSRRRRRQVLFALILGWAVIEELSRDHYGSIWPLAVPIAYLADWLWFRFLDPAYPQDDIKRGPNYRGPSHVPREAWQGALAAAGILLLIGLAIWLA